MKTNLRLKKRTKGKGEKKINTCTDRVHARKQGQRQKSRETYRATNIEAPPIHADKY